MSYKSTFFIFLGSFVFSGLVAQSNGLAVYKVLEENCISCHSNGSPAAGLDLEGSGATTSAKWAEVYQNLLQENPQNVHAQQEGYSFIFPGRPDQSFLFQKVNGDFEETITLDAQGGSAMPENNPGGMADVDKEILRQWILFGAEENSVKFDEDVVRTYYDTGGQESFPDGPPAAPDPSEGFQVKMGPFFLAPGGSVGDELEYFQKYALDLPANTEVVRMDTKFSGSSHHFIAYSYDFPAASNNIEPGLRLEPFHNDVNLVIAVQEASDIRLPEGSAFKWEKDIVLDLNSHYINYSLNLPYKAEAYMNVYTQEDGTAAQEMFTDLIANPSIVIPNNQENITLSQPVSGNGGEIYLWAMMGHTHKYGTDYKVWKRSNGVKTDLIYNASCPEGIPSCVFPNFDYRHIPISYFDDFLPLDLSPNNGFIHEASWLNDGPNNVFFGPTSDDEMMVLVLMYLEDIEGVVSSSEELAEVRQDIKIFPNPMNDYTEFQWDNSTSEKYQIQFFDNLGRVVDQGNTNDGYYRFERNNLAAGIYYYRLLDENLKGTAGKLIIE